MPEVAAPVLEAEGPLTLAEDLPLLVAPTKGESLSDASSE